jgi:hypothetical protein
MNGIPRDTDGKIMVEQYREETWHVLRNLSEEIPKIKEMVDKHEADINHVKIYVKVFTSVWALIGMAWGYLKFKA